MAVGDIIAGQASQHCAVAAVHFMRMKGFYQNALADETEL